MEYDKTQTTDDQFPDFKLTPENWRGIDELIPIQQTIKRILTIEQYIALEGQIPKSIESVKCVNGEYITENIEYYLLDSLGRNIPCQSIAGTSWTGLPIPIDSYGICQNPWKHHLPRSIFLGVDGFHTELGTPLCLECWERNEHKIKLRKWLFFYKPEIF